MSRARSAAITLFAAILVSGCGATDPMSLLPPIERSNLMTLANDPAQANGPVSVEEMLSRVRHSGSQNSIVDDPKPLPPLAEIRFHPKERNLTDRHLPHVEAFSKSLVECPNCDIVIELPTYELQPMLHYQRALSIARYLKHNPDNVRLRVSQKLPPHVVRLKIAAGV